MNFDLVDFQKEIKTILLNTRNKNRLSHAYIFQGPPGVGKKEMAYFFSMLLNCKEEVPCMKCDNCKKILNDEHLNVRVIKSDLKVIKKEEIISLQEEFSRTSLIEGPRVYIILDADKMNQNSQNSLLKFIEEPQPGIYGVLCTSNISQILPTIVSRCQTLNFKTLDDKMLEDSLEKMGIEPCLASILSKLTNNIKDALELQQDSDVIKLVDMFNRFLSLKNASDATIYQLNNITFFDNFTNLNRFLNLLVILYEDILAIYNGSLDIHLSAYIEKINKYKEKITKEDALRHLEIIYRLTKMLASNCQAKNVITNLFVNIF